MLSCSDASREEADYCPNMADKNITELIRMAPMLDSRDTVRRAAGLIRASESTRLLVVREGIICGTVDESSIAGYLGSMPDPESALDDTIEPLIQEYPVHLNASATLREAAQVFSSSGVDLLPVIDSYGNFSGVLYRRDVIGLLTRNLRPPTVAGMATPLGVHLTTTSLSGGSGSLGLYLTGAALAIMLMLSKLAGDGVMSFIGMGLRLKMSALLASTPLTAAFSPYDIPAILSTVLGIVFFAVLMRLSPLAGYHGAEHMTVHAIEAGEELSPENVRRFPRVHPRCGTNLLVGASIFILITSRFGGQISSLIAILIVVIGWRTVGGWVQYAVTTKRPNDRQLASGIAAGKELLKKYQERPHYHASGFGKAWEMGFLQTAAGMGTIFALLTLLQTHFKIPVLF